MELVKYQRSAPSVRLLNEIDILLTQVRLAELYLKQAQAAAADQATHVLERYESKLENLHALIRQKERPLTKARHGSPLLKPLISKSKTCKPI
jgi:hypothetical protein